MNSRLIQFLILTLSLAHFALAQDLDLGAMVQPVPKDAKFSDPDYHIWCGAPVQTGDGKVHLFFSRWPKAKTFMPGWATSSEIAYAVADAPGKSFKFVNVALPARGKEFWDGTTTHNPNIIARDGKFYLFYMGNTGDGKYWHHRNNQRVGLAIADKPQGPWTRFDKPIIDITPDKKSFDSLCCTNPAATFRPDGSVLVIYKAVEYVEAKESGGRVRYGAAIAEHPEGPYIKQSGRIFESTNPSTSAEWMLAEDPFIWFSPQAGQRYYAVARDVVGVFTGASGGIAQFESQDGLTWRPSAHPKVLGGEFAWSDGSTSKMRIERPALLFDESGQPIMLFGATNGYSRHSTSYNIQIPLRSR